ncbi:hypothetical protein JOD29_003603 [Lysinibacillus composti]|uniref:Uncharacterized protein n=1 Tax=Lysinibacillus composti TaxID=720633 RepID=A0A3N9UBB9_9BACI|nr:hypothetical protein [Lysinibacillus composti]MBM7610323.1 hypothetical protein [Lysinibacillus composti]RQW73783.1 hypothetical protein EBB45_14495 [Lysinibacillus composti]
MEETKQVFIQEMKTQTKYGRNKTGLHSFDEDQIGIRGEVKKVFMQEMETQTEYRRSKLGLHSSNEDLN